MDRKYNERITMIHTLLGNKCAVCGTTVGPFEIDHENPLDKSFDISNCYSYKLSKLVEESKKCQLLCKPCHKEKTKKDQKVISYKKSQFITDTCNFNPLTQEWDYSMCIDTAKKDGREYVKYMEELAEIKGITFYDQIWEFYFEVEDALLYDYLKRKNKKRFEEYCNDLEKKDSERYEKIKKLGESVERWNNEIKEKKGIPTQKLFLNMRYDDE